MIHRIWRQRRRLLTIVLMGLVAGLALSGWTSGSSAVTVPPLMLGIGMATILIVPHFRHLALNFALFTMLAAVLTTALGYAPSALLILGIGAAAAVLLPAEHVWLNGLRLPWIASTRAGRFIEIAPETLWRKVYPTVSERHWDPALSGILPTERPDHVIYAYATRGYRGGERIRVHIFDVVEGQEFKLRDLSLPNAAEGGPVSVTQHCIEPHGEGAILRLHEGIWQVGLWSAISLWLDDYLADHADHIAALLEERRDWSIKAQDAQLGFIEPVPDYH